VEQFLGVNAVGNGLDHAMENPWRSLPPELGHEWYSFVCFFRWRKKKPYPTWYEPERGLHFQRGMSLKRKKEKAKDVWVDHPEDGDQHERRAA
jgi:hypothetical protein